ncbi:MAG: hypothetical protein JXR37_08545 [Kiritimatiellae bacterium]|nr:hypothetical protein [Kiritimatiellia bacterium]
MMNTRYAFPGLAALWLASCLPCARCHAADGLAANYPGDEGITIDSNVVFVEDFEQASTAAVFAHWDEIKTGSNMTFSADVPAGSAGTKSLMMTHIGGEGTGCHLYRRLLPGYDRLHARWYVKFDPDTYEIHHFGTALGGYNPPTRWPQGGAGIRPSGDDRFSAAVEPFGSAWRWDFYSYWMGMRACPTGDCWGNDFVNDASLSVARGQWICVELMLQMNDPCTATNGEMALWIDGEPFSRDGQIISHLRPGSPKGYWVWDSWHADPAREPFEGFRWRAVPELSINYIWTSLYMTKPPEGYVSRVWFDHIVVAKTYIGPMKPASPDGVPPGSPANLRVE